MSDSARFYAQIKSSAFFQSFKIPHSHFHVSINHTFGVFMKLHITRKYLGQFGSRSIRFTGKLFVGAGIMGAVASTSLAADKSNAASKTNAAEKTVAAKADDSKPNILLIVADDLGNNDVGFQGGKEIPTPHIDSIAANGVQFTNGYVSCPVCSPTRAGLVTGRYQERFGHEFNPGGNGANQTTDGVEFGLPLAEKTIANSLKDAGYVTANVGKWHLGTNEKHRPLQRGFDEHYGFLGGAHPYIKTEKAAPIFRNNEVVDAPEHLTSAFAKEAAEFIKRQDSKPYSCI